MRDIFTMQIGRLVYSGATFAASIAFARILGLEQYGLYAVVIAFVSTFKTFTNLGQTTTLLVFFAEEYGKKNKKGMARVLKNFLQVSFVHVMLLCTLAIISKTLAIIFYNNSLIGSFAIAIFVFHMLEVANSGMLLILQAIRRIRLKTILEQAAVIAALILGVVLLLLGYGIWGIIIGQLITSALFVVVSAFVYRRMMKEHNLPKLREILRVKSSETQEYLKQGLWFAADKSIGNMYPNGLFFVLSLVAPVSTVGIARIALQLTSLSSSMILPQVAELSTTVLANIKSKGINALRKNIAKVIKHSLVVHALFSIGAIIAIPFLIPLFYGLEYSPTIPITLWLILLSLANPLSIMNSPLLRIFRKVHYSIIWGIVTLAAMVTAIIVFSKVTTPEMSFVIAYALGQFLPILLSVYIFRIILNKGIGKSENMKKIFVNTTMLIISLTLSFLVLEAGLRITGIQRINHRRPHLHRISNVLHLNYELLPNLRNERGYNWEKVSSNSLGERGLEPDSNKKNIAGLCDSFAFGFGLNNDKTNSHYLREAFPKYNIRNLSVSGYNVEQMVRAYLEKHEDIKPDLVILQFYWNDMDPSSFLTDEKNPWVDNWNRYLTKDTEFERMKADITKPGTIKIPFKAWLQTNSATFNFVEKRTKWLPFRKHIDSTFVESISDENLEFYEKWFVKLSETIKDSEKIFVIWPETSLHFKSKPRLHAMAEKHGWHVLDLYEILGMGYESLYWDWHPNASAQKSVGEALVKIIQDNQIIN